MTGNSNKYICIHGHFYQPPRENAWLEVIEVQDSAYPYHDWNERISAECYAPNAASRILDQKNIIRNIINNYSKISFNFGPTLLSWMEEKDPDTYEAILEADRESKKNFSGHGSAMAQVYNHMILPLANRKDKETQVIWGIRDFEKRFKRKPEGIWLAETAVDTETLEVLAENDIKFTVLAPRQAKAVRKLGDKDWKSVNDQTINTKKSYVCTLPSGKQISLFYYDGGISQAVAFQGLLNDGRRLADSMMSIFDGDDSKPQLSHVATDGETYGHHHKHGEMALAYCVDYIEKHKDANLTNYGEFLAKFPPEYETQIFENSSWSCVHGVERWRNDCGCNSGGNPTWNQQWRKPLRDALDWLRDESAQLFDREGRKYLVDPWVARNEYINIVLERNDENNAEFLKKHARGKLDTETTSVFRLLEMQRHAMLMYTSCGWFFDEISGIETTQILQYACRVIQLFRQVGNIDFEEGFIRRLELAPSNIPVLGNGAVIYTKYVQSAMINLQRVGMHYAVSSVFEEEPETLPVFNYEVNNEFFLKKSAGEQVLVLGVTKVKSRVTHSEKKFAFAVIYLGKHELLGNISLDMEADKFASMQIRVVAAFQEGRSADVIGLMQTYFGPDKYTIWQLFQDEKRKILNMIALQSLEELQSSLRRTYNRDYSLITALSNNDIPIPNAYKTTFEYVLNAELLRNFQSSKILSKELERIVSEMERWNLKVEDRDKVSREAGECITRELKKVAGERGNAKRIQRLNRVFPMLWRLKLEPNLHDSQNLYFEIAMEAKQQSTVDIIDKEWITQFNLLGDNLGVKVE